MNFLNLPLRVITCHIYLQKISSVIYVYIDIICKKIKISKNNCFHNNFTNCRL
jgi:hypothetical protein